MDDHVLGASCRHSSTICSADLRRSARRGRGLRLATARAAADLALVRTLGSTISMPAPRGFAAGTGRVWRRRSCSRRVDFERSLDAFPIEYGEIIASHEVLARSRSVRRAEHPARGSAPRVRSAGQEPSAPPARGLHRGRRPAAATSRRWSASRRPASSRCSAISPVWSKRSGRRSRRRSATFAHRAHRTRPPRRRRPARTRRGRQLAAVDAVRVFPAYLRTSNGSPSSSIDGARA